MIKEEDREAIDKGFMRLAINLARRGIGKTSPNPLVGAVIVKEGRVVGKGYHKKAGTDHGEIVALKDAGERAKDGTLYLNLEPCNHYGRTPPCTLEIIKSGIKKVVVGMEDPNPIVNGRGIEQLKKAGIDVKVGLLEEECRRLNESYIKYITTKTPFVILKVATTLDGKIADSMGRSQWITGDKARRMAHRMRAMVDAVMVGVETVIRDDPLLNVRLVKGRSPHRIVVDSHLRVPLEAKVLKGIPGVKTMIATTYKAPVKKVEDIRRMCVELIFLPYRNDGVDLNSLMKELGELEVMSLLIEGGTRLATSAVRHRIVDKLLLFYSPKILGGTNSYPIFLDLGIRELKDALVLKDIKVRRIGEDILVEGYI